VGANHSKRSGDGSGKGVSIDDGDAISRDIAHSPMLNATVDALMMMMVGVEPTEMQIANAK
jgi:hypothetical protein